MFKLRTVDVWDTLLRRNCHPEAVKLATAHHIFLRYRSQLAPSICSHWSIYQKRIEIESAIAREAEGKGQDGEYEITHVLHRLLTDISSIAGVDEAARECAGHELEIEIANTYADPEIVEFLQSYPADQTLFLSDFYMDASMLKRLLTHHGLDAIVPDGLVSCDVMRNKRTGRLFELLHQRYTIQPGEHVHIGDNQIADVEVPSRLGISAVSYLAQTQHALREATVSLFANRNALFDHIRLAVRDASTESSQSITADEEAALNLGIQAAPLFIGFMLFVAERTVIDKLDRLYFATREGEFFLRIFEAMFPDGCLAGCKMPSSDLLQVSRQATFAASLSSVGSDELNRVWNLQKRQKVSTLFGMLGVDPFPHRALLADLGLALDETILNPQHDPRLAALLQDEAFASAARKAISENRNALCAYLQRVGIDADARIGIVDIGWRGTIQDNLARTRPDISLTGYYLALRAFLNEQPANTEKFAFGPDERWEQAAAFFATFEPLELLCASPDGSVVGYREGGEGMLPIREKNSLEDVVFERFTRHFQDGVLKAAAIQAPLLSRHGVMSVEMREMALDIWSKVAMHPPAKLLEAYYSAPQHDVFDAGGFLERDRAPSISMLVRALFMRRERSEVIQYIRRTQWIAAIDGLPVSRLNRAVLRSVFRLAHLYKRHLLR